jgi:hypothetical protein
MKNIALRLLAFNTLITSLILVQIPIAQASPFPTDPQKTQCAVDKNTFNSWFGLDAKAPLKDAPANAANSVFFPSDNTKCDFYKWSSQMFLWLSSPSGESYIFDSATFFVVSAVKPKGYRSLISNDPTKISNDPTNSFSIRSTKSDENLTGETGQAGGGGVLISQNNSLVYYGLHVNDVYAYFLSKNAKDFKTKSPTLPPVNFPSTLAELNEVVEYANTQGVTLNDAGALTMELKTSWVDVLTVSDPRRYLKITAKVPDYTQSSDQIWSLKGTTIKTLALVGMHIAGTVQNHPEMVWATVEHISNAPNSGYYYKNAKGDLINVPIPETGDWTFTPKNILHKSDNWNVEKAMTYVRQNHEKESPAKTGDITATKKNTIGPSTIVRENPWGSASNAHPNTNVFLQDAENNAELISLNNDVLKLMPAGDVRGNYFVSGAVWTQYGNIPNLSNKDPNDSKLKWVEPFGAFKQIGSISLANSTMETFHQGSATSAIIVEREVGCFGCHYAQPEQVRANQGVAVSHIYGQIQPIP